MVGLENWMSDIPNDTQLHRIIMPGSHDAGMYVVHGKRGGEVFCSKNQLLSHKTTPSQSN